MYIQIVYTYTIDVIAFDADFSGFQFLGGFIILISSLAAAIHKKWETEKKITE